MFDIVGTNPQQQFPLVGKLNKVAHKHRLLSINPGNWGIFLQGSFIGRHIARRIQIAGCVIAGYLTAKLTAVVAVSRGFLMRYTEHYIVFYTASRKVPVNNSLYLIVINVEVLFVSQNIQVARAVEQVIQTFHPTGFIF